MHIQFQDLKLPLLIVGLGKTGTATRELLISGGVPSESILTFDDKIQNYDLSLDQFLNHFQPKTLVVSPGVPLGRSEIQKYLRPDICLMSELELAARFLTSETLICITGSIGKSTVTSLIGEGLREIDPHCFVGGNLGIPFAEYALRLLKNSLPKARYVVLELSSYQLENFKNLKTVISVFTYLSPNHLERYESLHQYYSTKLSLLAKTSDIIVCNRNGGDLSDVIKNLPQSHHKIIWTDRHSEILKKFIGLQPKILGEHNLDNIALAFSVFEALGAPDFVYKKTFDFPGLPHRLENLGEKNGVLFINDSKATAMDSTLQACGSLRSQFRNRHLILLIGGKDKNMPWEKLGEMKNIPNTTFRFFGEVAQKAQTLSQLQGKAFHSLKSCLPGIQSELKSGDIVLLAPGGTSLDEFKSFEERGDFFRNWVKSLEDF